MNEEIYWLPCLCRQALRGGMGKSSIRRYVEAAGKHWRSLHEQRERDHQAWSERHLCRRELLRLKLLRELGVEQDHSTRQALLHLRRYADEGKRPELARAIAHWSRAEVAQERYFRARSGLASNRLAS